MSSTELSAVCFMGLGMSLDQTIPPVSTMGQKDDPGPRVLL